MNLRVLPFFAGVSLVAIATGCGGKPRAPTDWSGPTVARRSTEADLRKVSVTIYNGDFALVREIREIELAEGRIALEYRDVAAHVQPESVHVRSLEGASMLSVFEQDYRYDLLSPRKLLEKAVGKRVRVYRWNEAKGAEEGFDAEVLAANGDTPVLRIGSEVTSDFGGRIAYPEVPAGLVATPTLYWSLGSARSKQRLEVSYLTREIGWQADYVLILSANDDRGDLTGWVTLDNRSGASFRAAELKLVAGDVQKLAEAAAGEAATPESIDGVEERAEPAFQEEGLFEYHLYTLARPTDVLDRERKQVTLLEGLGAAVEKKLVFAGVPWWYRSTVGRVVTGKGVDVTLKIANKESNRLGIPLPKGTVRVYKADASGAQQFLGEDAIDHTARDEDLEIRTGTAFDVVGDRVQMSWSVIDDCSSESSWEIKLRNHKDAPVRVEVVEPVDGDWEIVSSSLPAKRRDAKTFTFDAPVAARGQTTVSYRVRVRWC
jgi:hypothetical protein